MKRRRNLLVWLGPLLTFVAAVSYFLVFARYPVLRDFPWLNLPLVLLGTLLSVVALRRAFALPRRLGARLLAVGGAGLSLLLAGLFCGYIFYLSYLLPAPTATARSIAAAPAIALQDQHGNPASLADYHGRKVVLTFYRGFW